MIHPRRQWAIQIDVMNACPLACSNCTRFVGNVRKPYMMEPRDFDDILASVKAFPYGSEPCPQGRVKVVGLLGGEPLLHPMFPYFAKRMAEEIPDARHRGLWTSVDWPHYCHPGYGPATPHVLTLLGEDLAGYLNWNRHGMPAKPNARGLEPADRGKPSRHQPLLTASRDLVPDEKERYRLIEDCWVQRVWSSTYTPKGFFPCEVMGHLDQLFDGPGGLPVDGTEWRRDMAWEAGPDGVRRPVGDYAALIERWCHRCGGCVPLPGRTDAEETDDVTESNLEALRAQGSGKRLKRLSLVGAGFATEGRPEVWSPYRYIQKEGRP